MVVRRWGGWHTSALLWIFEFNPEISQSVYEKVYFVHVVTRFILVLRQTNSLHYEEIFNSSVWAFGCLPG